MATACVWACVLYLGLGQQPVPVSAVNTRLTEVFSWKVLQYQYSSAAENASAAENGHYVPAHTLPLGIERWQDKLFVAVPRFKPGVYATLNYIRLDDVNKTKSPLLVPYPSAEENAPAGPRTWPPRLVSVCRVRADACDRLWAVDSGVVDLATAQMRQLATPRLVVYDLKTDKLVLSYPLKDKVDYNERSMFPTITVDVTSANCDHAFAYLPDVYNYRLVVYSMQTNSTHTVTHNYFHFDPLSGDFSYGSYKWQWQDGVFGLALSETDREGYRIVYFHALASTMEFALSTKVLQNATLGSGQDRPFKVLGSRGPGGQSSASFIDEETGILFYTLINKHAVGCWNYFKGEEYDSKSQAIVAEDEETLSFPNDLKVDRGGNLWVLNTPLPELFFGSINTEKVNFRVFSTPVRQLVKGTACEEM